MQHDAFFSKFLPHYFSFSDISFSFRPIIFLHVLFLFNKEHLTPLDGGLRIEVWKLEVRETVSSSTK